jgi:hypothetical protein
MKSIILEVFLKKAVCRGVDFTWSDLGSSEQQKGHVKPNPDRSPGQHKFTTLPDEGLLK